MFAVADSPDAAHANHAARRTSGKRLGYINQMYVDPATVSVVSLYLRQAASSLGAANTGEAASCLPRRCFAAPLLLFLILLRVGERCHSAERWGSRSCCLTRLPACLLPSPPLPPRPAPACRARHAFQPVPGQRRRAGPR